MKYPYIMAVDESHFYENEKYDWVDGECEQIELGNDGFWVDEIVFECINIHSTIFADPPTWGIRLRAWDDIGNWKRSNDILQNCETHNGYVEWAYMFEEYPSKSALMIPPGEPGSWAEKIMIPYCDAEPGEIEIYENTSEFDPCSKMSIPVMLKYNLPNTVDIQAREGLYPSYISVHLHTSPSDVANITLPLYPDISLTPDPGDCDPNNCVPLYYRRGFLYEGRDWEWGGEFSFIPQNLHLCEGTSASPIPGPTDTSYICIRLQKFDTQDPNNPDFYEDFAVLDHWDWAGGRGWATTECKGGQSIPPFIQLSLTFIHKRGLAKDMCGVYPNIFQTEANVITNGHAILTLEAPSGSGFQFNTHQVAIRSVADFYVLLSHGQMYAPFIGPFKKSNYEYYIPGDPNHTQEPYDDWESTNCRWLNYADYLNSDLYFGVSSEQVDIMDGNVLIIAASHQLNIKTKIKKTRDGPRTVNPYIEAWSNLVGNQLYNAICGYQDSPKRVTELIQNFYGYISYPYTPDINLWEKKPPDPSDIDPIICAFMESHCVLAREQDDSWNYREWQEAYDSGEITFMPDGLQPVCYDGSYIYTIVLDDNYIPHITY
jgi:hypothetical protein